MMLLSLAVQHHICPIYSSLYAAKLVGFLLARCAHLPYSPVHVYYVDTVIHLMLNLWYVFAWLW